MGDRTNWLFSGLLMAALVVLALVVKGGQPGALVVPPAPAAFPHDLGAIVIERERLTDRGSNGKTAATPTFETLIETSKSGRLIAEYSSVPAVARAQQTVEVGNAQEIYDPQDNTIYDTTVKAILAAQQRLIQSSFKSGTVSVSSHLSDVQYGSAATPGWTSPYAQDVRDHSYRVAGETTINGQAALILLPSRPPERLAKGSGISFTPATVYVSPTTYDPIRAVSHLRAQRGFPSQTTVTDWLEYRVIPATPANRRLLSLTALHPTAKISHSAMAYVRATTPPGQV